MALIKENVYVKSADLTLAAYTHFGARGLRGVAMYHLVKEVWRRGYLRTVIAVSKSRCQYDFDLRLVDTFPGESRFVNGFNEVKKNLWRAFPSRWLGELIFDRYAASRLEKKAGILMTTLGMVFTERKAKALGYKTILYGSIPHPIYLMEQIKAEKDHFGLDGGSESKNRSRLMQRFEEHLEIADYIIALSEFARDTYLKQGFPRRRIFVAPTGVDLNKFQSTPAPSNDAATYLFVGHANGASGVVKGLQYLLRAWSELNLEDARLLVCGKIGDEAQKWVKEYNGKLNNVEFKGYVSDPARYYRQSSVFILPSLAEGMAKVTLEAMASGRPVIVTPNSGAVARCGIDGFFVPPRDVEALKEKILYFYHHREKITEMGSKARERAESFTWDRFSQQIADIVEEVAG